MKRFLLILIGGILSGDVVADMEPMTALSGNAVPLTLTMVVEQQTCDLTLISPETVSFNPVIPSDLLGPSPGPVLRLPPKTISLNLTNCGSSARSGAVPAIQVLGNNPFAGPAEVIFRDDGSTADGVIGFGLRYQEQNGTAGAYLKNLDFVDLAGNGMAAQDSIKNFLVDLYYGGGPVGAGSLQASLRFRFMYH